jgi:arylsulfatase A-like enzyme
LPRPPNFNEADISDKPPRARPPFMQPDVIQNIRRKYRCELESLLSVDEGVAAVIQKLNAERALDDTVVIYTSDNGFFHGEHRIPSGKMKIYEESIRVPLLMRGPGIPRGVSVDDLAINADLAPTILDVANADPGLVMDGRSLIPVANDPGIEQGRELLIEEPTFKAIRTERFMYAEHRGGARELYDLLKDPFELRSRHADPAYNAARTQLAGRLRQLRACAGSSCRLRSGP